MSKALAEALAQRRKLEQRMRNFLIVVGGLFVAAVLVVGCLAFNATSWFAGKY